MTKKEIKNIVLTLFCLATVVELILGILELRDVESGNTINYFSGGYLAVVIYLLFYNNNRKKKYFKMVMEKKMSNEMIFELIGKTVVIRTLDEYITGIVKSTDGDFIIVEKEKKNGIEKTFINKNSIQTIRIK